MGIMNIGAAALQANLVALQTAGNNIANVNTAGYSRQSAVLKTVLGQFTGAGYIGKGVTVETVQRNFSAFLNRQADVSSSTAASDITRADRLKQLEGIFEGGPSGLGAAISDMMNSMSDVASAPTDLTARTVMLTRVDETAARMRAASQRIEDLQSGVKQELAQKVDAVNTLAKNIADVNQLLSKAKGNGQSPNDLLDQRDQLIRELNRFVQTTSIPADDGTVGIFLGGSQALVLGSTASKLTVMQDDFGDVNKSKVGVDSGKGAPIPLDETTLGGGEITGLIRFQNTDLNEGRNLLGRLTMAISTAFNEQHHLGLDLDGNIGGDVFTPADLRLNILKPVPPAIVNTGASNLELSIDDVSKFIASDYELSFNSTGTGGSIKRMSDGVITEFDFSTGTPATGTPVAGQVVVDGLRIRENAGPASPGDRFMITPFATAAVAIHSEFTSPRALAVASPVVGQMGSTNKGSLQQVRTMARSNPPTNVPVTLTFTSPNSYTRSDDPSGTVYTYTSNQPIEGTIPATTPLTEWTAILQGSPQAGDTFTIFDIKDPTLNIDLKLNAGNAVAIMDLRDKAMFDGAALTDGYAGLISQIGIRTQSANYSASVSTSIAANIEKDRAGVSGVNLDEEAAKMLQFQQAYQASAKMLNIAQSIFQSLLQEIGR